MPTACLTSPPVRTREPVSKIAGSPRRRSVRPHVRCSRTTVAARGVRRRSCCGNRRLRLDEVGRCGASLVPRSIVVTPEEICYRSIDSAMTSDKMPGIWGGGSDAPYGP